MSFSLPIQLLHPDAKLPVFSSELAAGCDFFAIEDAEILPDEVIGLKRVYHSDGDFDFIQTLPSNPDAERLVVKRSPVILRTGLAIQLNPGQELEIRGRSGLGFNHDIIVHNGTIDADYTGEIKLKLWNQGIIPFKVTKGMRVAQGIFKTVLRPDFDPTLPFRPTQRRGQGFGSTGL